MWPEILGAGFGCYLLKLVGTSAPRRLLRFRLLEVFAFALPVSLLSALIATQTFTSGNHLVLDARAAGLGVALLAVALRAPFVVVVVAASTATALVRLIT